MVWTYQIQGPIIFLNLMIAPPRLSLMVTASLYVAYIFVC